MHEGTSNLCPKCQSQCQELRGIEVGHIFYLGTKYSKIMNAGFLDIDNQEKYFEMGCYGIGVGRTVAAAIEQNHDDKGIIFPWALAPFQVMLINLDTGDSEVSHKSQEIYRFLEKSNIEVLYDDRNERPGVKFSEADLMGIPLHIILGKRALKQGVIETKLRVQNKIVPIKIAEFEKKFLELVKNHE